MVPRYDLTTAAKHAHHLPTDLLFDEQAPPQLDPQVKFYLRSWAKLELATELFHKPYARVLLNTKDSYQQHIFELLYEEVHENEDLWFNQLLDPKKSSESNAVFACNWLVAIFNFLFVQQRLNGQVQECMDVYAMQVRILERFEIIADNSKNRQVKLQYRDRKYRTDCFSFDTHWVYGKREVAITTFRDIAIYEYRSGKHLKVTELLPTNMTFQKFKKLTDKELWKLLFPKMKDLSTNVPKICSSCCKEEREKLEFQYCGRCSSVLYCSKECQKAHWKQHKKDCVCYKV